LTVAQRYGFGLCRLGFGALPLILSAVADFASACKTYVEKLFCVDLYVRP